MERLVSAYKNKLTGKVRDSYKSVVRSIFSRYRKHINMKDFAETAYNVTFTEFSMYVMDQKYRLRRSLDEHWAPYTELCHPCIIPYDYIGKYETLEEDAREILNRIGAPKSLHFPPVKKSKTRSQVASHLNVLLPSEQRRLYKIYSTDFVLFDYPMPSIRNMSVGS